MNTTMNTNMNMNTIMNMYIDAVAANAWCVARGITSFAEIDAGDQDKLLLRASEWIDARFRFRGTKQDTNQGRAWPRRHVVDEAGETITGIPQAVIQVTIELAILLAEDEEAAEQALGISPAIVQQKAGGVEVRFADRQGETHTRLYRLLQPYLYNPRQMRVERG